MSILTNVSLQLGSLRGHWEWMDEHTVALYYGRKAEMMKTAVSWDWERWQPTVVLTGKDQMSVAAWAKQVPGEPTPTPAPAPYGNRLRL